MAGGYNWIPVRVGGRLLIPPNAVKAGEEHGLPVYVARVARDDAYIIGKLSMWVRRIGYSWHGKEIEVDQGEVLCGTEGQSPVWITGAFGEEVDGVVGCPGMHGQEYVGRTIHKGTCVPGKVVPKYNCMYFPYAGESSCRKYQLLSSELTWVYDTSSCQGYEHPVCHFFAPGGSASPSSFVTRYRGPQLRPQFLFRNSAAEASYRKSGDGEWVQGAVISERNKLIGRAFVNGKWQLGTLSQGDTGLRFADCRKHAYFTYEILLARSSQPTARQVLCLTIKADEAAKLQGSEDTFVVSELSPGESAWSVVREIVGDMQSLGDRPFSEAC